MKDVSDRAFIVNLLRLGDVFMSLPAIEDVAAKFGHVDLLVNSEALQAQSFLPSNVRIFEFPRKKLQERVGESRFNLFSSFDLVDEVMRPFSRRRYSHAYNFSNEPVSSLIMQKIDAFEYSGTVVNGNSQKTEVFGSSFKLLNATDVTVLSRSMRSYTDYLRLAVMSANSPGFKQSRPIAHKRKESEKIDIALQMTSAEKKKSFDPSIIAQAIEVYRRLETKNFSFNLLGAPWERDVLIKHSLLFKEMGIECDLVLGDFQNIAERLKAFDLLITPDTSTKHLAAHLGVQTLEICTGSSNPYFTPAYSDRAYALLPSEKLDCYPCGHRGDCSKNQFECKQMISPEVLALVIHKILHMPADLFTVAEEYADQVQILKMRKTRIGLQIESFKKEQGLNIVKDSLQNVLSLVTLCESGLDLKYAGTTYLLFRNYLLESGFDFDQPELSATLGQLSAWIIALKNDLDVNLGGVEFSQLYRDMRKIKRCKSLVLGMCRECNIPIGKVPEVNFNQEGSLFEIRWLQSHIAKLSDWMDLSLKLVRSLQDEVGERKNANKRKHDSTERNT